MLDNIRTAFNLIFQKYKVIVFEVFTIAHVDYKIT